MTPEGVLFTAGIAMVIAAICGWFADRYDERADARRRNS